MGHYNAQCCQDCYIWEDVDISTQHILGCACHEVADDSTHTICSEYQTVISGIVLGAEVACCCRRSYGQPAAEA